MTINLADNTPRVSYALAQGATQQVFTVSFEFFDDADLNVYVDGTLKTLTTDYLTADNNDVNDRQTHTSGTTGFIHFTSVLTGISGGSTIVVTRDINLERTTDFPTSGAFAISTLNTELDRLTAIAADFKDSSDRALQLTDFDAAVSLVLPDVDTRKGTVLAFNSTTGAVEAGPQTNDVTKLSDITADIATLADIEDGTDATDAIQTVAGISSNVTTVAGISSNVSTVAGISSNVTAVAGDATDIGIVSTNIANVNTVAGISANVTTVASDATDIGLVAGSIANVNTTAANIADVNNFASTYRN